MAAYLVEHPPASKQYRRPRRSAPSGVVVVHTAENTPDYVAFDGGAEAVAGFISRRTDPGSYHTLVDSGGPLPLVPYEWEAFHDATGSNPHSLGLSFATRADVWPLAPTTWRNAAIEHAAIEAARMNRWVKATTGVTIPARMVNRAQSEQRMPGFISHAARDPKRRTDPGAGFPWTLFLSRYAHHSKAVAPDQEDDMQQIIWFQDPRKAGAAHAYHLVGIHGKHLDGQSYRLLKGLKVVEANLGLPFGPDWQGCFVLVDGPCKNVK